MYRHISSCDRRYVLGVMSLIAVLLCHPQYDDSLQRDFIGYSWHSTSSFLSVLLQMITLSLWILGDIVNICICCIRLSVRIHSCEKVLFGGSGDIIWSTSLYVWWCQVNTEFCLAIFQLHHLTHKDKHRLKALFLIHRISCIDCVYLCYSCFNPCIIIQLSTAIALNEKERA